MWYLKKIIYIYIYDFKAYLFMKMLVMILIMLTRSCYGDLVCCCESVEGRAITMLNNWVDWICLL